MALRPLREEKAILRDDSMMHVYREILLNIDKCRHFFCTLWKENDKNVWKKKQKCVPLPQIWITMSLLYPIRNRLRNYI